LQQAPEIAGSLQSCDANGDGNVHCPSAIRKLRNVKDGEEGRGQFRPRLAY
jgi:hypothetical protein